MRTGPTLSEMFWLAMIALALAVGTPTLYRAAQIVSSVVSTWR